MVGGCLRVSGGQPNCDCFAARAGCLSEALGSCDEAISDEAISDEAISDEATGRPN